MKKVLFIITGMLVLVGCNMNDEPKKTYQDHEQHETVLQEKEKITIPEPEPEPEPEPQKETLTEKEKQELKEKNIQNREKQLQENKQQEPDPAERFEQIQNMTKEERSQLSEEEKHLYGISDDGEFFTENASSKEQIEKNNNN